MTYQQNYEYFSHQSNKSEMFKNEKHEETVEFKNRSSIIHIGLNNKISPFSKHFFWNYRDENHDPFASSILSESILIDELKIINYRINTKDISKIYLKGK